MFLYNSQSPFLFRHFLTIITTVIMSILRNRQNGQRLNRLAEFLSTDNLAKPEDWIHRRTVSKAVGMEDPLVKIVNEPVVIVVLAVTELIEYAMVGVFGIQICDALEVSELPVFFCKFISLYLEFNAVDSKYLPLILPRIAQYHVLHLEHGFPSLRYQRCTLAVNSIYLNPGLPLTYNLVQGLA